ncbi:MAG: ABC transporter ATP-binding protein [Solirubrobacteraceae bacterium]
MLFDLHDVTASRGGRVVLRGVDLGLEEGATAVVGPSGSGKSTLLRLLNRLADPDAGEVRFRGRPLSAHDVLGLRREVALVPQLPALVEGTVADNVELGARLAGESADVDRALALAGLDPSFGPRLADGLSVGEQQRVMLARALALKPSVLLLDEPTSALDERTRAAVEATLVRLASELDLSLVVVTHDPAQARRLARRTVTVASGRVA